MPHLLDEPAVAVRVGEREERPVVSALGFQPWCLPLRAEVEWLADPDAAADKLRVGGLDVVHDQVQALVRPGRDRRDPGADRDRARRPWRRELYDAERVVRLMVDIDAESELLRVERLGPVHVADGEHDELQLPVHVWISFESGRQCGR
jgi:hypothetical protein